MTDSNNPFAATPGQGSLSRQMIVAWSVAAIGLAAAVLFLVLWQQGKRTTAREMEVLRGEIEKTSGRLAQAIAANETNQATILLLTNRVSTLEEEKKAVGQMARSLEDEMRKQLESKDVTISKLQGKLTVTIVDRVMFDSGEAVLKPDGAAVMTKIAELLAAHPELKIHVVGHTDNVPIRPTAQSRYASNWELSVARALAAVHFLTEQAGVDPRRMGALGHGEFHPIADNATPEGRAKNRRIEVTILPPELDTAPALATPDATPQPE